MWTKIKEYADSKSDSHKVGDIITTLRTDLGSKWTLCNGGPVYYNKNPKVYELLCPDNYKLSSNTNATKFFSDNSNIDGKLLGTIADDKIIFSRAGYFLVYDNNYNFLYSSKSAGGLDSYDGGGTFQFLNGKYIIKRNYSPGKNFYLAYSDTLDGEWSTIVSNNSYNSSPVEYANNYYMFYYDNYFYRCTSLQDIGDSKYIGVSNERTSVCYLNGYYIMHCPVVIAYTNDWANNFTKIYIRYDASLPWNEGTKTWLYYINNTWHFFTAGFPTDGFFYGLYHKSSSTLEGFSNMYQMDKILNPNGEGFDTAQSYCEIVSIDEDSVTFLLTDKMYSYDFKTQSTKLVKTLTHDTQSINSVVVSNGNNAHPVAYTYNNNTVLFPDAATLPTLSSDKFHVYIKIEE